MSTDGSTPALRAVAPGVLELVWETGADASAGRDETGADARAGRGEAAAGPTASSLDAAVLLPLLDRAFGAGAHRVEAEVPVGDRATRIALQRAGLRPEGTARGRGMSAAGEPVDVTLLARLAEDPEPGTRESFLAMLNATLPRTRAIAQGVVRDDRGRVLVCELTYKKDWDLPGGVVDPHEAPRTALEREVLEELGVALTASRLLAVNWLPPYRQWDDALLFVYDLGTVPDLRERAVLESSELAGVHWLAADQLEDHLAPYAARHLRAILSANDAAGAGRTGGAGSTGGAARWPLVLEDGRVW